MEEGRGGGQAGEEGGGQGRRVEEEGREEEGRGGRGGGLGKGGGRGGGQGRRAEEGRGQGRRAGTMAGRRAGSSKFCLPITPKGIPPLLAQTPSFEPKSRVWARSGLRALVSSQLRPPVPQSHMQH